MSSVQTPIPKKGGTRTTFVQLVRWLACTLYNISVLFIVPISSITHIRFGSERFETGNPKIERLGDLKGKLLERRHSIAVQGPIERVVISGELVGERLSESNTPDAIRKFLNGRYTQQRKRARERKVRTGKKGRDVHTVSNNRIMEKNNPTMTNEATEHGCSLVSFLFFDVQKPRVARNAIEDCLVNT